MKVIDLLNKIANGEEVPEKIQVYNDIFVFDDSNGVYEHEETRTNLLSIYNGNILDYEVRIKEEDKKIEKIKLTNGGLTLHKIVDGIEEDIPINSVERTLVYTINEIIDYLEENKKC